MPNTLFSSKYHLTSPQYGKYPWIGVFKTKRLGLGGCAGTLVATNWFSLFCRHKKMLQQRKHDKSTNGAFVQDCDRSTLCEHHDEEVDVHCSRRVWYQQQHWCFGVRTFLSSSNLTISFFLHRKEVKLAEDPIVHECYGTPKKFSNDIALLKVWSSWTNSTPQIFLLKLAEDVDLTVYTPACLPQPDDVYTGQTGNVYGELKSWCWTQYQYKVLVPRKMSFKS